MNDKAELYWRMFQENCEHGRHHESQRQSSTNLILVLSGAAVTLISHNGVEDTDAWLALFIFLFGAFGAAFTYKNYERFRCHMARAAECIKRLEAECPGMDLSTIMKTADAEHEKEYPKTSAIRLYWYWLALHLAVMLIGAGIFIQAIK